MCGSTRTTQNLRNWPPCCVTPLQIDCPHARTLVGTYSGGGKREHKASDRPSDLHGRSRPALAEPKTAKSSGLSRGSGLGVGQHQSRKGPVQFPFTPSETLTLLLVVEFAAPHVVVLLDIAVAAHGAPLPDNDAFLNDDMTGLQQAATPCGSTCHTVSGHISGAPPGQFRPAASTQQHLIMTDVMGKNSTL